jgi:hypothetical protein
MSDTGLEPVTSSMSRKRASQLRQSPVQNTLNTLSFNGLRLFATINPTGGKPAVSRWEVYRPRGPRQPTHGGTGKHEANGSGAASGDSLAEGLALGYRTWPPKLHGRSRWSWQWASAGRSCPGELQLSRRRTWNRRRGLLRLLPYPPIAVSNALGACRSGQTGQTVNLLAYAYGGSNPSAPITGRVREGPARGRFSVFGPVAHGQHGRV